jgi:hypothetical protein
MNQLMLAHHYTSVVLKYKSLVHHPMEVVKVPGLQSIGQSILQTIQETLLLPLVSVNFMRSIARQPSELGDILIHGHGPMFQMLELLLF